MKQNSKSPIQLKTITLIAIALVLAWFGFSPKTQAVSPPPDGGYPGFNTAEGQNALLHLTTGVGNAANGWYSLFSDTGGSFNTGVGAGSLLFATGNDNTAVGVAALLFNSEGSDSTAVGAAALSNNTADANTGVGSFALQNNTTGGTLELIEIDPSIGFVFYVGPNTAVGSHALESNIDSSANTAVGYQALGSMVHGSPGLEFPQLGINTAVGFQALANLNGFEGFANDAHGYQALFNLTDGHSNLAVGAQALFYLNAGNSNIAIGPFAGDRLPAGEGNIYIGTEGPFSGPEGENSHTYIGNINFTSVSGGSADTVTVDLKTGLLGHLTSSRRHKEDIKPMDNASETLYRLKPVTYRYKKEIDRSQVLDYGLIAEEVAEIDPNLTVCNKDGQIESVRYTAVNAMLLNEFLKEHRKVEGLEVTVAKQKKDFEATVAQQQKQIEGLTAGLQKVSAQVQMSRPAPQMVNNNQ